MKYNIETVSTEPLYSFPMKFTRAPYLSVSDRFIVSLDKDTETIKLYNKETGNSNNSGGAALNPHTLNKFLYRKPQQSPLKTILLPQSSDIYNLCFSPDGDLLVTGLDTGKKMLNKYRLAEDPQKDIQLIWSCDQVPGAVGVAAADSGLIFVSGGWNATIYVGSPEGKKIII